MTIKETPLASNAISIIETKFGNLYFYDNFLITEIFEGIIVGRKEFNKIFNLCLDIYDNDRPFGIVSHRVHPYSVNLFELIPISDKFNSVVANAVIAYTDISVKNFELEKRLLKFKGKFFNNLNSAISWTNKEVEKAK
ncbi:hypothetical protein [Pontimicrobium aquaticum]|uniref:SpoIIAA-like n=1 Tax=Pontimicrobium aquaticum TaxID=2565367 RepID=A0A4U0EQD6_9FLAO|nr:hypothetical protein [Pontimicrobium aquaticum]TJY33896.1 hypothetical protein E5167_11260 [Pontimicrobium aquaticum]